MWYGHIILTFWRLVLSLVLETNHRHTLLPPHLPLALLLHPRPPPPRHRCRLHSLAATRTLSTVMVPVRGEVEVVRSRSNYASSARVDSFRAACHQYHCDSVIGELGVVDMVPDHSNDPCTFPAANHVHRVRGVHCRYQPSCWYRRLSYRNRVHHHTAGYGCFCWCSSNHSRRMRPSSMALAVVAD